MPTPPSPDHDVPDGSERFPAPLTPVEPAPRRTPAEEARTLVADAKAAALATLSDDGTPWASMVVFGLLGDGAPVLTVSTLAEHGRNLAREPRGSLLMTAPFAAEDPLRSGRVTLAGRFERPDGARLEEAQAAYREAVAYSGSYDGFGDFSVWVLRVERVRWVGGYGAMGSADAAAYAAAEADPTAPSAVGALAHLNADHADALLLIAQQLAGYPDATAAVATAIDRYGMELAIETPRGGAPARVGFIVMASAPDGLRAATVELARRARARAGS
ncbi:MAG TPA: DUF2470 domain-containing protein [Conexibacter sp.]|jgi:hypothetical protein